MPNGMRSNPRERELKRRSTLDPLNLFRQHNPSLDTPADIRTLAQRAASSDVPRAPMPSLESERPDTPPIQPTTPKIQRFSMMRWRHHSESQLSTKAREHAERENDIPPVPAMPTTPAIIMTAPTSDVTEKPTLQRTKSRRFHPFTRQKQANGPVVVDTASARPSMDGRQSMDKRRKAENRKSRFGTFGRSKDPAEELRRLAGSRMTAGDEGEALSLDHSRASSTLALPMGRKSESSRSEGGDLRPATSFGNTPTTPERPYPNHAASTFSFLTKRNKQRGSLFPLPDRVHAGDGTNVDPLTPRPSTNSARSYGSPEASSARSSPPKHSQLDSTTNVTQGAVLPYSSSSALAASSLSFAAPAGSLLRTRSVNSALSSSSSPALLPPMAINGRTRSSTLGSNSGRSDDAPPPTPPFANGGRDSTSTAGRSSFQHFFNLNRLRHGSDPHSPRGSPSQGMGTPAYGSHNNSLHLTRESYHLPDREEGETAIQFLARVDESLPKKQIPSLLADKQNDFHQAVMRSFMRKFTFFGDPLDMALRKLLLEVDLPNEAQQIDRVLQSFADRYHECNPGIFSNGERAYFIAFSLILLHSDYFNKNNKKKMLKNEYVKNTFSDEVDVSVDVLECFYDNIIYTQFIRVEDDMDIKTIGSRKSKRVPKALKNAISDPVKKPSREPLDPYTFILDGNFEDLRPPLKGVLAMDDPYSYLGTAPSLDKSLLRSSKCGIIQLESARSRPDAFMSPSGIENPNEARAGVVDLPVDKVGVLWRKDPKKKTARSPWQEWGAILTGAGLYFFKNTHFVKNFITQYEHHKKHGHGGTPCVFTPPVTTWKADYMLPTDNSVALLDTTYKKHKHAFVFFRHNNADETFLADNESEMNDWLAKLNHQAAFKTAGIRQRGLIGGHYDGQRQRGMRRLESSTSTATLQTVQTPTGDVTIQSGKIDSELAQQITAARRDNMQQKISEAEEKLAGSIKLLDDQLRDARHILLLAPIHERTRNNVLHAASRVSVQLNWTRIEIWRMKCHRDILAMDLEEEKNEAQRRQERIDRFNGKVHKATSIASQSTASTAKPRPSGIERLSSNATTNTVKTTRSPVSPISTRRPDTQSSAPSVSEASGAETGDDDVFQTPPETTPVGTPFSSPMSLKSSGIAGHRGSIASTLTTTTRSPRLRPQSLAIDDPLDSPSISEYRTPMMTDTEAENQREVAPINTFDGSVLDRPTTATSTEPDREREGEADQITPFAGSPDSKSKVRRSFHKTLRDSSKPSHRDSTSSHHKHHRRGPKSDSTSSAVLHEDKENSSADLQPTEGLRREMGSFTLHGKKASVVNFGGDWTTTEERLKGLTRNESIISAVSPLAPVAVIADEDRPELGYKIPPRKSSLSLRERRAASYRKTSSASFGGKPTPLLFENGDKTLGGEASESAIVDEEETVEQATNNSKGNEREEQVPEVKPDTNGTHDSPQKSIHDEKWTMGNHDGTSPSSPASSSHKSENKPMAQAIGAS